MGHPQSIRDPSVPAPYFRILCPSRLQSCPDAILLSETEEKKIKAVLEAQARLTLLENALSRFATRTIRQE
jgi:hypothetical protein